MSIRSLEQKAGIGNGTIAGWKEYSPSMGNLQKVSRALEIPLTDLVKEIT